LAAGEAAGLHDDIITALVAALTYDGRQREVFLEERGNRGPSPLPFKCRVFS
jgi:hypothetical protein